MRRILIVDNDEGLIHFLSRLFVRQGYEVAFATDGAAALNRLADEEFDVILLDYKMPGLSGLETLKRIKQAHLKTPVIVMTAHGTNDTAIEAMKIGAYDYLLKPFDIQDLEGVVADAVEASRLMKEVVAFGAGTNRLSIGEPEGVRIVGSHRKMQHILKLIGQVAEKDVTVLITGESGTGKELVARAIYHHSRRKDQTFVAINCATIPDGLFESELFGYEQGAFTGADRPHVGKFERCDGGTLFFDEIGDMSLSTQAKVLRVLQEGEFERLGGTRSVRVNVRILAATNKDLETEVREGRFREDLYYRLKIICIDMPPLRERIEDIRDLVDYFAARFAAEYDKSIRYVSDQAIAELQANPWPGNVRQLENCMRRAVLICKGDVLLPEHVRPESGAAVPATEPHGVLPWENARDHIRSLTAEILQLSNAQAHANLIDLLEETLIGEALKQCNYNQVHTARLLGISRNTLRHRIRKFGLSVPTD